MATDQEAEQIAKLTNVQLLNSISTLNNKIAILEAQLDTLEEIVLTAFEDLRAQSNSVTNEVLKNRLEVLKFTRRPPANREDVKAIEV